MNIQEDTEFLAKVTKYQNSIWDDGSENSTATPSKVWNATRAIIITGIATGVVKTVSVNVTDVKITDTSRNSEISMMKGSVMGVLRAGLGAVMTTML